MAISGNCDDCRSLPAPETLSQGHRGGSQPGLRAPTGRVVGVGGRKCTQTPRSPGRGHSLPTFPSKTALWAHHRILFTVTTEWKVIGHTGAWIHGSEMPSCIIYTPRYKNISQMNLNDRDNISSFPPDDRFRLGKFFYFILSAKMGQHVIEMRFSLWGEWSGLAQGNFSLNKRVFLFFLNRLLNCVTLSADQLWEC